MTERRGAERGVERALELAVGGGAPAELPPGAGAEQLPLLDDDVLGIAAVAEAEAQRRARGRPPGARNRRTEEWADYLASRYAHPLEVLARMASAPVDDLARGLNCSKLEALQEKRQAAVALLPYMAQRQAVAVDVKNRSIVHLTIHEGATSGGVVGGALDGEVVVIDADASSETEGSDGDPDAS